MIWLSLLGLPAASDDLKYSTFRGQTASPSSGRPAGQPDDGNGNVVYFKSSDEAGSPKRLYQKNVEFFNVTSDGT